MIERSQWGVCRVLLEQGVSVQSCLDVLPIFIEKNQWTLVARVMEFIVDDDLKHRVVQRAMKSREGSVVWRCLSTMQYYQPSVEDRERWFDQAIDRGMWQLVKPLVEIKDSTGVQHRDKAFLMAIKQRQWDVVDYCQLCGADIDMKDNNGNTALFNEITREDWSHGVGSWGVCRKDWKAIKELVRRGAKTNIADNHGRSVLNLAIEEKQWHAVELLIQYHADIHAQICYRKNSPRKTG
jgi:hypothetical protein